jgi:hypothetical protein
MHIIAHRLQIPVAAALHRQRLVPSAEQMPEEFVSPIEPRRVSAQEPLHSGDQIGFRRLDHQVKVIVHQTPGMHLPVGFNAALAQGLHEASPVCVVLENGFAPVPAVHQVANRPRIMRSEFSRHVPSLTPTRHLCQCLGLTLF